MVLTEPFDWLREEPNNAATQKMSSTKNLKAVAESQKPLAEALCRESSGCHKGRPTLSTGRGLRNIALVGFWSSLLIDSKGL